MGPPSYVAVYSKVGLTADAFALLVDLSNASYPHGVAATELIIEELILSVLGTAGSAGDAVLYVGVVKENDATNGTYFKLVALPVTFNTQASLRVTFGKNGANVTLVPGETDADNAMQEAAATVSGDETGLQNDAGDLEDALGNTNKSAADGDLILHLDEGTNGGTYTINATVTYRNR